MSRTVAPTSSATGSPAGGERDYAALYRLLTENSRELVSRHSPELTFLYASPGAQFVLGHSENELLGHRLDDFTHPDDLASLLTTFALAAESGEFSETVFRCRTGDGDWRWCEISCRGVRDETRGSVEVHATIRDISRYKKIEKAMERVAREWRSTFDAAHDAILMLDAKADILRVNLATLALFDCEFRDLIGASIETAFAKHLELDPACLNIRAVARERITHRVDVRLPGRNRWFRISIDPILMANDTLDGMVLFLSDITAEKNSREKLLQTLEEVRQLSKHLDDVRESERRSIAREVHDELGHALTAMKMEASWLLRRLSPEAGELEQRSGELLARIDETIEIIRRIVTNLRPPVLDDLGLDAALDWLIADFRKFNDVEIDVDLAQVPERLVGNQSITIFRIVQEALTNIRRHAQASRLALQWEKVGDVHKLSIRDDGCGFESEKSSRSGRFGLLGIEERARSLNGSFEVESAPGKGTSLTIRIPDDSFR